MQNRQQNYQIPAKILNYELTGALQNHCMTVPNIEESSFPFVFQIATNRRMTVKYNPPSSCILEISVKGIKLAVQEDYYACDRVRLLLPLDLSNLK